MFYQVLAECAALQCVMLYLSDSGERATILKADYTTESIPTHDFDEAGTYHDIT